MKLTVLGCGDAFGSGGRYTTSFLLEQDEKKLLVDCGATTLVRLKQLQVPIDQIDTVVITHFHGDHFGGLPFVVLSRYFEYDHQSMTLIGPVGLKEKLLNLQEALYPGTAEFYEKLGIRFLEYSEKERMVVDGLTLYARKVTHSEPTNPHGVKLTWKGKTFAYSGDTSWNGSLIDLADGSDLFIIECNNFEQETPGHLSYKEVMQKKEQFRSGKILLTHMSSEMLAQPKLELDRLEDGQVIEF